MNKFFTYTLNIVIFVLIILVAVSISTIALAQKVNDAKNQYSQDIRGSVIKEKTPIIVLNSGIVDKIAVKTGDEVKKGDILVVLTNPAITSEIKALKQFPSNVSAATQANVDEQKLSTLTVSATTDGIVGDISTSVGASVSELSNLMTLYSNDDIRLLVDLTDDQYQQIRHASQIQAYSQRLNQSFTITPDILNPDEIQSTATSVKKLGLYFKFKNNIDAASLLNNEDLVVQLNIASDASNATRPIDYFINFWNRFLGK